MNPRGKAPGVVGAKRRKGGRSAMGRMLREYTEGWSLDQGRMGGQGRIDRGQEVTRVREYV